MDRRTFLTGVGTIGAVATGGWATLEPSSAKARADGLAQAAGASKRAPSFSAGAPVNNGLFADGLTLGYLPGSAGILASEAAERRVSANATGLKWSRWDASMATQSYSFGHPLLDSPNQVSISIGVMQRANTPASLELLQGIEIIAHFAINDVPYVAPFNAWKYAAAGFSRQPISSQPLRFDASVPDRVALQINYTLNAANLVRGVSDAGMMYLPIGARGGPGTGLYVLATPSRYTGMQPDLNAYRFTGNLKSPLVHESGYPPDFDFLTLTIRPLAA